MNLLKIPSKDAYSYARVLLDLLFSEEEQKTSVVITTNKVEKQPLDSAREEKLFSMFTTIIISSCFNHCHIHYSVH